MKIDIWDMYYRQNLKQLNTQGLLVEARNNNIKHDISTAMIVIGLLGITTSIVASYLHAFDFNTNLLISSFGVIAASAGSFFGLKYGNRYFDLRDITKKKNINIPQSNTVRIFSKLRRK